MFVVKEHTTYISNLLLRTSIFGPGGWLCQVEPEARRCGQQDDEATKVEEWCCSVWRSAKAASLKHLMQPIISRLETYDTNT